MPRNTADRLCCHILVINGFERIFIEAHIKFETFLHYFALLIFNAEAPDLLSHAVGPWTEMLSESLSRISRQRCLHLERLR